MDAKRDRGDGRIVASFCTQWLICAYGDQCVWSPGRRYAMPSSHAVSLSRRLPFVIIEWDVSSKTFVNSGSKNLRAALLLVYHNLKCLQDLCKECRMRSIADSGKRVMVAGRIGPKTKDGPDGEEGAVRPVRWIS